MTRPTRMLKSEVDQALRHQEVMHELMHVFQHLKGNIQILMNTGKYKRPHDEAVDTSRLYADFCRKHPEDAGVVMALVTLLLMTDIGIDAPLVNMTQEEYDAGKPMPGRET